MYRSFIVILLCVCCFVSTVVNADQKQYVVPFYLDTLSFNASIDSWSLPEGQLSVNSVAAHFEALKKAEISPVITSLLRYKLEKHPDDWMFYQIIRRTAEVLSPKSSDYNSYTFLKWYLLTSCGYDAILGVCNNKMLFYVQSNDLIYDIPTMHMDDKQYVCLNYHDFNKIDLKKNNFEIVPLVSSSPKYVFSYQLSHIPQFSKDNYEDKVLSFAYAEHQYEIKLKVNKEIPKLFANYPVADYKLYLNAPLSAETYNSLIPQLKKNIKNLSVKDGIDYLQHFTRYAFVYKPDADSYGKERRFSPELTLSYEYSDCEDRSALFYFLVKEIYNIPMIVLEYKNHVTVAVKLEKPIGNPVVYNGVSYTLCEPTPQEDNIQMGRTLTGLVHQSYDVAFVYNPIPVQ